MILDTLDMHLSTSTSLPHLVTFALYLYLSTSLPPSLSLTLLYRHLLLPPLFLNLVPVCTCPYAQAPPAHSPTRTHPPSYLLQGYEVSPLQSSLCGSFAGGFSAAVTTPLGDSTLPSSPLSISLSLPPFLPLLPLLPLLPPLPPSLPLPSLPLSCPPEDPLLLPEERGGDGRRGGVLW